MRLLDFSQMLRIYQNVSKFTRNLDEAFHFVQIYFWAIGIYLNDYSLLKCEWRFSICPNVEIFFQTIANFPAFASLASPCRMFMLA